jgi:acyl-CoA synthetase (AMP-forming)/AMP-acid ligase II
MLDLRQYASLGAALKDALERWPNETCLIEADRDREKVRLTYSDFKEMARPLCRALEDADFKAGDRAAIIMTNQSKWLISAYSIFFCGGVLVPLDYKLTAAEHLQLLAHSKARFLVVEYYLWRAITAVAEVSGTGSGDCAGHGSAGGSGLARRLSLGGIQEEGRAAVCGGSARTRPASSIRPGQAGVRRDACLRTTVIWSSALR